MAKAFVVAVPADYLNNKGLVALYEMLEARFGSMLSIAPDEMTRGDVLEMVKTEMARHGIKVVAVQVPEKGASDEIS